MIEIGDARIGDTDQVFVISEIGANFASVSEAKEMILASANSGADAVKFQTFRAETVALPGATFTLEDGTVISQYEYFKERELTRDVHIELQKYSADLGLVFFSTPGYYDDVELLESIEVPAYKTGSDDLTNYPFLRHVAALGKPMFVSTGMCTLGEVERAVETISGTGNNDLILLHCIVGYPASVDDANLRMIDTLKRAFGLPVGFSDHCRGSVAGVLSVGFGAVAIEKHLTLDRSAGGPDNDVACEASELEEYVLQVRAASMALGSGIKKIFDNEKKWRQAARKSIVAARDISVGEVIGPEMLAIKRPSTGLHPEFFDIIVGRRSTANISANELMKLEDFC